MELVEKNILPVESSLKEAIIGEDTRRPEAGPGLWASPPSTSRSAWGA